MEMARYFPEQMKAAMTTNLIKHFMMGGRALKNGYVKWDVSNGLTNRVRVHRNYNGSTWVQTFETNNYVPARALPNYNLNNQGSTTYGLIFPQ